MALRRQQATLQNVGFYLLVLASVVLAQQDTVCMIQHSVQSMQIADHEAHGRPRPTEAPAPLEFKAGEYAEVKVVSGPRQNTWVPCRIVSKRKALGYNIELQFEPEGQRKMSEVPDRVLRKVEADAFKKAVTHLKEHPGSAKVLAEQVEREAGRRQRANAVMIKNGKLHVDGGGPNKTGAARAVKPLPPPPPPRSTPQRPSPRPEPARLALAKPARSQPKERAHADDRSQPERGPPRGNAAAAKAGQQRGAPVQKHDAKREAAQQAAAKQAAAREAAKQAAAKQAAARKEAAKKEAAKKAAEREAASKQAAARRAAANKAAAAAKETAAAAARQAAARQAAGKQQAAARRAAAVQRPAVGQAAVRLHQSREAAVKQAPTKAAAAGQAAAQRAAAEQGGAGKRPPGRPAAASAAAGGPGAAKRDAAGRAPAEDGSRAAAERPAEQAAAVQRGAPLAPARDAAGGRAAGGHAAAGPAAARGSPEQSGARQLVAAVAGQAELPPAKGTRRAAVAAHDQSTQASTKSSAAGDAKRSDSQGRVSAKAKGSQRKEASVSLSRDALREASTEAERREQKREQHLARVALEREAKAQAIAQVKVMETKWKADRNRAKREAEEAAQCRIAVDSDMRVLAKRARHDSEKVRWQRGLEKELARRLGEERRAVEQEEGCWRSLQEQSRQLAEQQSMFAALDELRHLREANPRQLRASDRKASSATKAVVLLVRSKQRAKAFAHKVDARGLGGIRHAATVRWNVSTPQAFIRLLSQGRRISYRDTAEDLGLLDEDIIDVDEDAAAAAKAPSEKVVQLHTFAEKKAVSAPRQASGSPRTKQGGAERSWEAARAKASEVVRQLAPEEAAGILRGSHSGEPGWYSGNTEPVPRLSVPPLRMQGDAYRFRPFRAGAHRTVTCWPSPLALAATWDEQLVGEVARAVGEELRHKGVNVLLGPAVNVQRLALHGRSFESLAGEDPHLGARLVRPFVHGVQSQGVIACAKHFAFNDQERYQPKVNYEPDERVAWELYYPPFEAAVQAGIGAVMCSDARVNGTHSCESGDLIKRDLKGRMDFPGFVLSQWDTMSTPGRPGQEQSAAHKRDGGLDLDMPGSAGPEQSSAPINLEKSADSLMRVLTTMYRIGVDKSKRWTAVDGLALQDSNQRSNANTALAGKAAAQSVVLLKNDGILPILPSATKTLAILGPAAGTSPKNTLWGADYYSGGGAGHVPASVRAAATPLEQIGRRAASAKLHVVSYTGSHVQLAKQRALEADVVVFVGAATASEGEDRLSLSLDDGADQLIAAVAGLRPTVVLLQAPGAVLTPWRTKVAAVASLFLAGEGTGSAWASVLFGDVVPAGKLPVAFPATEADIIKRKRDQAVRFPEGLHTSYRSTKLKAAFPFGHGLSYARFLYGRPKASSSDCPERLCVSLTIRNDGHYAGSEVAQVYLSFPHDREAPHHVLRGFEKTLVLQPGEEDFVTFALTQRDLSTYSSSGRGWVLQQEVKVGIGASSKDIRRELLVHVPEVAGAE